MDSISSKPALWNSVPVSAGALIPRLSHEMCICLYRLVGLA